MDSGSDSRTLAHERDAVVHLVFHGGKRCTGFLIRIASVAPRENIRQLIEAANRSVVICPSRLIGSPTEDIMVCISNYAATRRSLMFRAFLIGMDDFADIAMLGVDIPDGEEPLESHRHLSWGKSRNNAPGTKVRMYGDFFSCQHIPYARVEEPPVMSESAVMEAIISDNRYVDYTGKIPGELLLLSCPTEHGDGLPVVSDGQVVGMKIYQVASNATVAISEFSMRHSIRGICNGTRRYTLGIRAIPVTPSMFLTCLKELPCVTREIRGYYVTASDNQGVVKGCVIETIEEIPIGDRKGQLSPSLIMGKYPPGCKTTPEGAPICKLSILTQRSGGAWVREGVAVGSFPLPSHRDNPRHYAPSSSCIPPGHSSLERTHKVRHTRSLSAGDVAPCEGMGHAAPSSWYTM